MSNRLKDLVNRLKTRRVRRQEKASMQKELEQILFKAKADFRFSRGYQKRLIGPALHASTTIQNSIRQIPGPVTLDPEAWDDDAYLNALFADAAEIRDTIDSNPPLKLFFRQTKNNETFALLTCHMQERRTFGVGESGGVIGRDVPLVTVSFSNHRILLPETSLVKVQDGVRRRILTMMVAGVLSEIQGLRQWKQDLETEYEKLSFFIRHADAGDTGAGGGQTEQKVADARELLEKIGQRESDIDRTIGNLDSQVSRLETVLMNPLLHFGFEIVPLRLNRLGVKVDGPSKEPLNEIKMAFCELAPQIRQGALWVRIDR